MHAGAQLLSPIQLSFAKTPVHFLFGSSPSPPPPTPEILSPPTPSPGGPDDQEDDKAVAQDAGSTSPASTAT